MALFGGGTHTITIITEAVDKASGKMRKISETVKQVNSQMGTQIETTGKLNEKTGRLNRATIRSTRGLHNFAFEFLGIMFLGMAIQRMFTGLIRTSLEWVGVQEIMSAALGILFLPIALQILDWAILFFQWVSELSPATQKFLGWIVLGGIVLGLFLFILGTIVLGLNSLRLALGITSILGWITGIEKAGVAATLSGTKIVALNKKTVALKKTLGRLVGATLLFGLALKDAAEGQLTAAIGDVLTGIGFLKGGKLGTWLMVVGIGLKLIGDEEFLVSVLKVFFKVIDFALTLGQTIADAIIAGITGREFNLESTNIGRALRQAKLEVIAESKFRPFQLPIISNTPSETQRGGVITVTNVNNFNGFTRDDLNRSIDESNIRLTEDVRRLIKT